MPEEPTLNPAPEETAAAAGEALSGVKGISLTPVLNALLMPTARYLGPKLRDHVKGLIEERRSQEKEANLRSHIGRNLHTFEKYKDNAFGGETLVLFERWIDGVEDVSHDNEELSALWDEVLAKILSKDPLSDMLLDKLRSLSALEAHLFLRMAKYEQSPKSSAPLRVSPKEGIVAKSIADKGLVQSRSYVLHYIILFVVGLYGLFGIFDWARSQISPTLLAVDSSSNIISTLAYQVSVVASFIAVTSVALFLFVRNKKTPAYQLTELGRMLARASLRQPAQPTQASPNAVNNPKSTSAEGDTEMAGQGTSGPTTPRKRRKSPRA